MSNELVTLVEPTGLQLTEWGAGIVMNCRTAPSGEIALGFQFTNAVPFVMALMQAIATAAATRQKRRLELGQEPDPEPDVTWPISGLQIRALHQTRSVALIPHLQGTAIPLTLTVEQSRQIAASLLKHADEIERGPSGKTN